MKPLYGHQEGALVGYNPKKPGRPSHTYHTFAMAGARLVLDVDVLSWKRAHVELFRARPCGRCSTACRAINGRRCCAATAGFGNEPIMREAEQRGLAYLFKLRLTANVKRMLQGRVLSAQDAWKATQARAGRPRRARSGSWAWSGQRRVIVLRRRVKDALAASVQR